MTKSLQSRNIKDALALWCISWCAHSQISLMLLVFSHVMLLVQEMFTCQLSNMYFSISEEPVTSSLISELTIPLHLPQRSMLIQTGLVIAQTGSLSLVIWDWLMEGLCHGVQRSRHQCHCQWLRQNSLLYQQLSRKFFGINLYLAHLTWHWQALLHFL